MLLVAREASAAGPGSGGSGASNAAGKSSISGIVRDAQGVAQMGALVQVLAANSMTVAIAFTDQRGHYSVANLIPGRYLVRASATLFIPATRNNLQLRNGASAVVNLTLATLFDTASWLPAERRRADEGDEDWKWTLRSTANRPILRMVESGEEIEVSSSASERRDPTEAMQARGAIESGDGGFGQGGVHTILTVHRGLDDGSEMTLRADFGSSAAGESADPRMSAAAPVSGSAGSEYALGYESKTGFDGGAARTLVTYKSHPELVSGTGAGYEVMEMTSAQRMSLGERVEIEAGGRVDAIRTSASGIAARPFFRLSAHPGGAWTLEYELATDRSLQSFGDVTDGPGDIPVALVQNGRLTLASGHHQEVAAGRSGEGGAIRLAFFRDDSHQTAIAGGEQASAPAGGLSTLVPTGIPADMLLDPATGSFRALGQGYAADGFRITASSPLTAGLWVAAEYSAGEALSAPATLSTGAPLTFEQAVNSLEVQKSESATLALKGRLIHSGTRVRASYRWQPSRGVTAVDPYSAFGDQAYFSCLVRQPLRWPGRLPSGLDATIDVTNLLAQGYRPFLSPDGQTLYFAQAPRTIQAGLSFNF